MLQGAVEIDRKSKAHIGTGHYRNVNVSWL